jgi:hypothetical protein
MRSQPRPPASGLLRVSLVAKDDRGFTHIYEELETTPAAVRDAFDLMARHTLRGESAEAPTTERRPQLEENQAE